jgi:hypothetical protein
LSEWWTYQPSDLLMFSPRIYWRLFESINRAWWPAQALLLAAGLVGLGRLALPRDAPGACGVRGTATLLAACWGLVAWAFLLQRFEPIQWVARGYAISFGLQAAGLGLLALFGGIDTGSVGPRRRVGIALGLWALLGHPLLSWGFGRPWQQAEVFGLTPDPTAIATLSCLLLLRPSTLWQRRLLGALWAVPIAWCLVSAATLLTLGTGQGWLMLAAAIVAPAAAWAWPTRITGPWRHRSGHG